MDKKIILSIHNENILKEFLNSDNSSFSFIYLGTRNTEIIARLEEKSHSEYTIFSHNKGENEQFIIQYLELIGQLNNECPSKYWWVTGLSAKNRFLSSFFDNLFIFTKIIQFLNNDNGSLLIINPPDEIIESLKQFTRDKSIDLTELLPAFFSRISSGIKHSTNRIKEKVWFIFDIWKRIFLSRMYLQKKVDGIIRKCNNLYILRSWFYYHTINENDEYHDSFFGPLPDYLTRNGENLVIVCGIFGNYHQILKKIARTRQTIVTEEFFLSYLDPIRAVLELRKNKPLFHKPIIFNGLDIVGIIQGEIDKEYSHEQILRDFIYFFQAERLIARTSIHTFTTTYENNPWEKMYYSAFSQYSPHTNIIGYQHTIITESSINLRLGRKEKNNVPLPHRIITIGQVSKQYLEQIGNYDASQVVSGCGLRFDSLDRKNLALRQIKNRILFVPGGITSRVLEMTNYVHRALKDSDYTITLRPHPYLPVKDFQNLLDFDYSKCGLFNESKIKEVNADLESSDMVIYDASTLALESFLVGVPVIHIPLDDILSYDPLYHFVDFKWEAETEEDLVNVIEQIYTLSDEKYHVLQETAHEYAKSYARNVTKETLSSFRMR